MPQHPRPSPSPQIPAERSELFLDASAEETGSGQPIRYEVIVVPVSDIGPGAGLDLFPSEQQSLLARHRALPPPAAAPDRPLTYRDDRAIALPMPDVVPRQPAAIVSAEAIALRDAAATIEIATRPAESGSRRLEWWLLSISAFLIGVTVTSGAFVAARLGWLRGPQKQVSMNALSMPAPTVPAPQVSTEAPFTVPEAPPSVKPATPAAERPAPQSAEASAPRKTTVVPIDDVAQVPAASVSVSRESPTDPAMAAPAALAIPPPTMPVQLPLPLQPQPAAALDAGPLARTEPDASASDAPAEWHSVPTALSERAAVRDALDRYRAAFTSLDAAAAKAVWPAVDARSLSEAFDQLTQQQFEFSGCLISVTGVIAVASCAGTARYVPRAGGRGARLMSRQWTFNLYKTSSGGWVINRVDSQ